MRFLFAALLAAPLFLQMVIPAIELPPYLQFSLATLVQFGAGYPFYIGTARGLHHGRFNMDSLVALGTTSAYFFSTVVLFADLDESLYFDASAVLIAVILLGKWLEQISMGRASRAIETLLRLQPPIAHVERDGQLLDLPTDQIVVGDIFVIRPGESVPVDGEVLEGASSLDESLLTGESLPVDKGEGSALFAGTQNGTGMLRARASRIGAETALSRIIQLVEEAQSSRAPIQVMADRVASYFVPSVIGVALLTFALWWLFDSFEPGLIYAVAVLVVACPCALGMATPTVFMVASGLGARAGIVIRNAEALEQARKLCTLVLDKTGTITMGEPEVTYMDPFILQLAASLEQHSEHPLGRAVMAYAADHGIEPLPVEKFRALPGEGVEGEIEGVAYRLIKSGLFRGAERLGGIEFADRIRPTSREAIERIERMGIEPVMLTGDRTAVAEQVAAQVGILEVIAEVLPDQKGEHVKRLKSRGVVGMVGDGINDAPALASADVGFAVASGSDVAIESAQITLMRSDLMGVVDALRLARATYRKMGQNLFFAFIYNTLGIPIAALGFLSPVIAGSAMALSSLCVLTNALLLRTWKPLHSADTKKALREVEQEETMSQGETKTHQR